MRMISLVLAAGVLLAPSAGAAQTAYVDGGGSSWRVQANRHGAVLRRGLVTIYLGRACDAVSPRLGRGRWGWANGGWLVAFPRRRIGFPRQEAPVAGTRCDVP